VRVEKPVMGIVSAVIGDPDPERRLSQRNMGGVVLICRRTIGVTLAAAFENLRLEVLRIVGIILHDPADFLDGSARDVYDPGVVMYAAARDVTVLAGFDDRFAGRERAVPDAAGRAVHPHFSGLRPGRGDIPFELRYIVFKSLEGGGFEMKNRNYGGVQRGTAYGGPKPRRRGRKSHSF
jgi:hypothetical protein